MMSLARGGTTRCGPTRRRAGVWVALAAFAAWPAGGCSCTCEPPGGAPPAPTADEAPALLSPPSTPEPSNPQPAEQPAPQEAAEAEEAEEPSAPAELPAAPSMTEQRARYGWPDHFDLPLEYSFDLFDVPEKIQTPSPPIDP